MSLDIWEQIEKETKANRKKKEAFINEINPNILKMLEVFNESKYEKIIEEKDLADLLKLIKKIDQEQKLNIFKKEHSKAIKKAFYSQLSQNVINQRIKESKESNEGKGSIETLIFDYKKMFRIYFEIDGSGRYDKENRKWLTEKTFLERVVMVGCENDNVESRYPGNFSEITTERLWEHITYFSDSSPHSLLDKAIMMNGNIFNVPEVYSPGIWSVGV